VDPLVDYLTVALYDRRGQSQQEYDREIHGEWALLVNTDGELYQVADAYDTTRSLGNIFTQPLSEILKSTAYRESIARDRELRENVCGSCRFRGPCSTLPLFESPRKNWTGERCPITYDMRTFVKAHLQERNFGERRIDNFLRRAG